MKHRKLRIAWSVAWGIVAEELPEAQMAYSIVLGKRGDDLNAAAKIARSL
jgi:hypothetical protein